MLKKSAAFFPHTITVLILSIIFCALSASPSQAVKTREQVERELTDIINSIDGVVGISAFDVDTGEKVSIKSEETFFMGSLVTIPIMITCFEMADAPPDEEGKESLDLAEKIKISDKDVVWNREYLTFLTGIDQIRLYDLCRLMITVDDYTAADVILNRLKLQNVNRSLTNNSITSDEMNVNLPFNGIVRVTYGLTGRKYENYTPTEISDHIDSRSLEPLPDVLKANYRGLNYGTPYSMTRLLVKMVRGELISRNVSNRMIMILQAQNVKSMIPLMLPEKAQTANKPCLMPTIFNDTAIVYGPKSRIVITIMGKNIKDPSCEVLPKYSTMSRIIYDYYNQ